MSDLEFVIKATVDKAIRGVKEFAKALGSVGEETKKTRPSLKDVGNVFTELKSKLDLAKEGFNKFIGVFKTAIEVGKQGAELDRAREKFDRLAQSIGVTSEVLLTDMKTATRGLISDSGLVASGTDLMSLGLAKSGTEVVRLSRVIGGLGMDMNQLVLTLSNQTTMRFDQLGVAVDGFDERVQKLRDSGMSASDAFKEAFLQQAEEQLKRVGDRAETAAGKFDKLEVSITNASDAGKTKLLPFLANAADGFTYLLTGRDQLADIYAKHAKDVLLSARSYKDYTAELERAAGLMNYHIDRNGNLVTVLGQVIIANYRLSDAQYANARSTGAQMRAFDELEAQVASGPTLAIENLTRSMDELRLFMSGPLGEESQKYAARMDDLKSKANELQGEIDELEGKQYLTQDQKDRLAELRTELDNTKAKVTEYADEHDLATKRILFDLLQQQLAFVDLGDEAEFQLLQKVAKDWGLIDDETYNAYLEMQNVIKLIQDGKLTVEEYADAFGRIPEHVRTELEIHQFYTSGAAQDYHFGSPNESVNGDSTTPQGPDVRGRTTDDLPGYASGGEFTVKGNGGTDSQIVAIKATPGEKVKVTTPGQKSEPSQPIQQITNNFYLTANYRYQSERSLMDEVRLLSLMGRVG